MTPWLELRNITKRFPGTLANDRISLDVKKGEIHAILGENGAGKTTLMNILYGMYQADEGEIVVDGKILDINSPIDAINSGIGMVHQHFMLVPVFTVAENIMLGEESTHPGGFLDHKFVATRIKEISKKYGLDVDPNQLIKDLPVGVQQRVEIIKLLYRNADILILDEPTAVLTPQEVKELFNIIRTLLKDGKSIIFITHKLGEVMEIADQITVIRHGRVVGTVKPKNSSKEKLAAMMVGHEVHLELVKPYSEKGAPVLSVENLTLSDKDNLPIVDQISFEVHVGEILGIAGVQGNGQTELVEAITGLRKLDNGRIVFGEKDISNSSPKEIIELGAAHIPEDRQNVGLVLPLSVMHNMILCSFNHPPYSHINVMDWDFAYENSQELMEKFDVRPRRPNVEVTALSGGNQQKVIIARELSRPIELLVAAQPTRGLDVGSIEYIHTCLLEKRKQGVAILLVSTELDEILQLSDRIAVMYRGKFMAVIPAEHANRENLGLLMAGIPLQPDNSFSQPNDISGKKVAQ